MMATTSAEYKVLTGTAMLSAMWSIDNKDVLDALMPFIRHAVGKETSPGDTVNVSRITGLLNDELGYKEVPSSVVTTALKRLAKSGLLRQEHGRFLLVRSLDDEVREFEEARTEVRSSHERVGLSLAEYLNEHSLTRRYQSDDALNELTNFFASNGLMVSRNPSSIEALSKKDDKSLYQVGQFILREHRRDSSIFDEIVNMAKGFFVSTALFAQPIEPMESKFKNTTVFLDTRIILRALGYHSPEERDAAAQLLQMLRDEGAAIACFNHTIDEITSILVAYKNSLQYHGDSKTARYFTLEGLNAENCTTGKVDVIIQTLPAKVHFLKIQTVEKVDLSEQVKRSVDEEKLRNDLSAINYGNEKALFRDLDSVTSVCSLRGAIRASSVERCGALFLTTNAALKRIANKSVGVEGSGPVPPVMLDNELGAMLWLKSYAVYGDYPRRKLVEDATLALLPTESIMHAFYDAVDEAIASDSISREEYDALRFRLFQQRELMKSIDGDVDNISEKTVIDVVETLRDKYRREDAEAIAAIQEEVEAARQEASDAKRQAEASISAARQEANAAKQRALDNISAAGSKRYELVQRIGRIFVFILLSLVAALVTWCIVRAFKKETHDVPWPYVIILVIDLWGAGDSILGERKFILKLVDLIAEACSDKVKNKERAKYEDVFDDALNE